MATITEQITSSPTSPTRGSTTYANQGDAFLLYISGMSTELNAWAAEVNAVKVEIDAAGVGGDATTLNGATALDLIPEQAGNAGKYLTTDGASTSWCDVDVSGSSNAGGAITHVSGVNITLTKTATKVQNIYMTAENLYLTLPDATTLSEGFLYLVNNEGDFPFSIKNNADEYQHQIDVGDCYLISLIDNSTSTGTWICKGFSTIAKTTTDPTGTFDNSKAGEIECFASSSTSSISATKLSATKVIVCYCDVGNNDKGTACILTIIGTKITAGTPVIFAETKADYISTTALTDSSAIVCYNDSSNNKGSSCFLTITDNVLISGTPVPFADNINNFSTAMLTPTLAVACYSDQDDNNCGKACTLTITGTTISYGTPVKFENAGTSYISLTALNTTSAVVCYKGSGGYGKSCFLEIETSTITPKTPVPFENSVIASYLSITKLTDTKLIVCYQNESENDTGTACIITITDQLISYGVPVIFKDADTIGISVTTLSATKALVCYCDFWNDFSGESCELTIDDNTISAEAPVIFSEGLALRISAIALDPISSVVCYIAGGVDKFGTARQIG